ncbi:MAG: sigma-70 family RNA polymerase sigma factor [Oscillospiraceae bacterium]|nr:sigma-70 family RNA polymerase sigma factor [Oscillospiraceae bacterium]
MDDSRIIDLYWDRNEQALTESDRKYGKLCRTVAMNILRDKQDTEECVNDTWLHAWNAMPPGKPEVLSAFLSRITRNLALDRYKAAHAGKRGGGQTAAALEELGDCIASNESVEQEMAYRELTALLDSFLRTLPEKECCIFLRRYWYTDTTREIARRYGMPEGSVKSQLSRTRQKLKKVLEKEGVVL